MASKKNKVLDIPIPRPVKGYCYFMILGSFIITLVMFCYYLWSISNNSPITLTKTLVIFYIGIFLPLIIGMGGVVGIIWCIHYFFRNGNKLQPDARSSTPKERSITKQKRVSSRIVMIIVLIISILTLFKAISMLWNTFSVLPIETMEMVDIIWNVSTVSLIIAGVILVIASLPILKEEQNGKKQDTNEMVKDND